MPTWLVTVLMVAGALLEATGILLIAVEILLDRRRARQLVLPRMQYQFRLDVAHRPQPFQGGPSIGAELELFERDESLAAAVVEMLSGAVRQRIAGVVLLLVGVVLLTAGNLGSVC